ncbi:glycosyltransferase [Bradyrhizobium sp. UFLA05-112]
MNIHGPTSSFSCNACQGQSATLMARRKDNVAVLRCESCGLGVIETIPDELGIYYDDAYYGAQKVDGSVGYNDYQLMAEHGLSWAAELVCRLKRGGKILDIGCADGTLLKKLPNTFDLYGIEVNEKMIQRSVEANIRILGRDLLDPSILENHRHDFDCVTAVAVFEHLPDFRRGIEAALNLLKPDGILLFEVPYISENHENKLWYESSLEHVFYPSGESLRLLIEQLGFHLVGGEIYVRDFASNFIGVVFRDSEMASHIEELFASITRTEGRVFDRNLRVTRQRLMLVHAANSTPDLIAGLADLLQTSADAPLLNRIEKLWADDLRRLAATRAETGALAARYASLVRDSKEASEAKEAQIRGLYDQLSQETEKYAALARDSRQRAGALESRIEQVSHQLEEELASSAKLARDSRDKVGALEARIEDLSGQLSHEIAKHAALVRDSKDASEALEARLNFLSSELDRAVAQNSALERHAKAEIQDLALHVNSLSNRLARSTELNVIADRERARLAAHIALLKESYADLNQSAECQKNSKELEVARLTENIRALVDQSTAFRAEIDQILRSTAWKSTAMLRRAGHSLPRIARATRRVLKLLKWTANLELRQRLSEAIQARRKRRAEEMAARKMPMPKLVFDARTCLDGYVEATENTELWPADRPLVTVVVTSFNYGRFVPEAVDSVLAQTFQDIEVIVVEGGSSDPESRERTLSLERPKTRVIAQAEPHQVGANRNFGIRNGRGKYICCLDADDLLKPTYIEKAVFLLETYGYDVVSCAMQQFGSTDEKIGILDDPILSDMVEGNHVLTCAVFRHSLWQKAGGFRDTDRAITGHVYEDWLFWARLAAMGARIHNFSKEHLFLYRRHGPSLSTQSDLYSMTIHRKLIQEALGDLVTPAAHRNSRLAAATDKRPDEPLLNFRERAHRSGGKPSILLALPFTIIGGAERLLSSIVAHLAKEGWSITVITSIDPGHEHGDATSWFEEATAEIFHLPRFLTIDRWPDFVSYLIVSREIDVVWIAGSAFMYNHLPVLRAKFPTLKVADMLFNTVGHTRSNRKYAELIDLNFVENREVLRFLKDAGVSSDRVQQISSGIDLDRYVPSSRDASVVDRLSATSEELIVGFSGRWSEEKDPLAFVEVAQKLSHLPIHFVMTGAGALRSSIESALVRANLGGRFHLIGEVEDVRPWIASYDVLVLPSRLDGRPVVVLEALALGVPVIASAVGGLPELIQDGVNGFLCQPRQICEFANRIEKLALDRNFLKGMKQAARAGAERSLDARKMLSGYEQGLRALAGCAN